MTEIQPYVSVDAPAEVKLPVFKLVMPVVQLGAMASLWGNLKVRDAYGRGSFWEEPAASPLKYGRLVSNRTGTAFLEYQEKLNMLPVTINEIYEDFKQAGVPDVSVAKIDLYHRAIVDGQVVDVILKFGRDTVHPQVYGKLVVDGAIPKQETYEITKRIREQLAKSVPHDVIKRMRYSCLVLYEVHPRKELLNDAVAILSMKEKNWLFIREIFKRWELYDYEYLSTATQP